MLEEFEKWFVCLSMFMRMILDMSKVLLFLKEVNALRFGEDGPRTQE